MRVLIIGILIALFLHFVCDLDVTNPKWWIAMIFIWFVYIAGATSDE
jgi:hypothetical protein